MKPMPPRTSNMLNCLMLLLLLAGLIYQLIIPPSNKSSSKVHNSSSVYTTSGMLIMTPSESISEPLFNYGSLLASSYPEIVHRTLPDEFLKKRAAMQTTALADYHKRGLDTLIVVPAIPGTAELFKKLSALDPQLHLIAINPMEPNEKYPRNRTTIIESDMSLIEPEDIIDESMTVLKRLHFNKTENSLTLNIVQE